MLQGLSLDTFSLSHYVKDAHYVCKIKILDIKYFIGASMYDTKSGNSLPQAEFALPFFCCRDKEGTKTDRTELLRFVVDLVFVITTSRIKELLA